MVAEFQSQLASIRRLDRQLGAVVAQDEVRTKIDQVANLLAHSMSGRAREQLGGLLSELYCLAGWQALDMGNIAMSWRHYDHANTSALESKDYAFKMLASAGRAFVLIDIGETPLAVDVLSAACRTAERKCSPLLRSWLSAALGEAFAANGQQAESLRVFDQATALLPKDIVDLDVPYVALDSIHLARWRGHALARCGMPAAVDILSNALERLDSTFIRAETALRVDLAAALLAIGERSEARAQADRAHILAIRIGSTRQGRRTKALRNNTII